MREGPYQTRLIKRLRLRFPGCVVLKNDSGYIQGIPDLTILFGHMWAVLEVKASEDADEQPNQRHYVEMLNELSFAAFIYPLNEEEVLDALQRSFETRGEAFVPKRK